MASYCMLQSTAVTALPRIQEQVGATQSAASWVMTAFLISSSVATPILGRLGDAYGKKRLTLVTLVLLAAGSVLAAIATNIAVLIVARVVQGVAGGLFPLAFGMVRDEMPTRLVPIGISLISSLMAIGFAAGMMTSGPILHAFGYGWIFLLPGLVAALAAVAMLFLVPESPTRSRERVPLLPALLLAGWLVPLLVGVTSAPAAGWISLRALGLIALAVVACAVWAVVEWRLPVPLIDLRMMTVRGVWSANVVALTTGLAMFAGFTFYPQFSQVPRSEGYGLGASVIEAGHITLPQTVGAFALGFLVPMVARRIGTRQVVVAGSLLTAAGAGMAAYFHDETWQMYVVSGLTGVGVAAVYACLANAVVAAVRPDQTGAVTGMNANIRTIGGAFGSAIAATLIAARTGPTGYPAEQGYVNVFTFIMMAAVLAAAAGLLIPSGGRRTTLQPAGERAAARSTSA
ncbi:MFS transporter [Dactylosporangium sp. NPDC051484]|uniref:MFS transporter n=1 Tax=Dactylosporangium sp. NPDC051484 TaxID=3154942 RepID=UPI00344FC83F